MEVETSTPLLPRSHFIVIPWLAQGHFIPMIDIARLIAQRRAAIVTVITTHGNATRISGTIARLKASGLPVRFATLRFPSCEAGLPDGCENLDSIPSRDMARNFYDGAKLLRPDLEALLRRQDPPPSCILSGIGFPWLDTISKELRTPRLVFQGFSCLSLLTSHTLQALHAAPPPADVFVLADLPQPVEITAAQLPKCFDYTSKFGDIYKELRDGELSADGFIVNSFAELEPGYAESLERQTGKKAWTIGPVSLSSSRERADAVERGNRASVDEQHCLAWLNSKPAGSVLYVSFGSMGRISERQWMEIGLGLEAGGRPFVWVVRAPPDGELERWLLDERFEERTEGRCLLIRGWAPQVVMLSHPAVGGFLTHCGWNSALEGICANLPMLTWPLGAEQFLNEKLIVEVLGIGVAAGATAGEEKLAIGREEVAAAVERLMGAGEGREARRRKATELGEMSRSAMEKGGSSHSNLSLLLRHVLNLGRNKQENEKPGEQRLQGNLQYPPLSRSL